VAVGWDAHFKNARGVNASRPAHNLSVSSGGKRWKKSFALVFFDLLNALMHAYSAWRKRPSRQDTAPQHFKKN
jgi:hypothetical protein